MATWIFVLLLAFVTWLRVTGRATGDITYLDHSLYAQQPPLTREMQSAENIDDDTLSTDDLMMIRQKILEGLGLKKAPTRAQTNMTTEAYDEAMRRYRRAVEQEEERYSLLEEQDLTEESKGSSYQIFGTVPPTEHYRRGRRSADFDEQIVHFSVASTVRRMYQSSDNVKATCQLWKTGGQVVAGGEESTSHVTVKVFQVSHPKTRRSRENDVNATAVSRNHSNRKRKLVLLQALNVSIAGDQWLTVDVSSAFQKWVKDPRGDATILVKCPDCRAAGVVIHTSASTDNSYLVPKLDVQTHMEAQTRFKRSRLSRATRSKWPKNGDCGEVGQKGKRSGKGKCCRHSMKVRFDDLPGFEFIESPREFEAYYCSGRCPVRYNPANEHALIQSLINMKHKKTVPGPCCAPTALKGLIILHYNEAGTELVTTNWTNIIVTECGCA